MSQIPIHVLSGFLGSGKTTLLNLLLKRSEFANTAVVVNEMGEIGLDHLLIAQSSDSVVLLDGGCLCCTVADSLHETLAALHSRAVRGEIPPFERVIVETTGVANPAPILNTLLGNRLVTDHYHFEALVVTVDAQNAAATVDVHPESRKQVVLADRLIWTKLDLAQLDDGLEARIRHLNPTAERFNSCDHPAVARALGPAKRHRVPVPIGIRTVPGSALLATSHDARLRSRAFVLAAPPSWSGIATWWRLVSESLGERLLRSKGLLEIADTGEVVFVQTVQKVFHRPERLPRWPDDDHRSRLVCITYDVDPQVLESTLDALVSR